jgi:hypothetical protein
MEGGLQVLGVLVDWSRNVLGDLGKRINLMKRDLEACRGKNDNVESVKKEEILQFKLSRLEDQKETYQKQRAHADWLKG